MTQRQAAAKAPTKADCEVKEQSASLVLRFAARAALTEVGQPSSRFHGYPRTGRQRREGEGPCLSAESLEPTNDSILVGRRAGVRQARWAGHRSG